MKIKMTNRQSQVLEFVKAFLAKNGAPPTRQEIADFFGFASLTAVEDHLRALAKKGHVELGSGRHRAIKVLA